MISHMDDNLGIALKPEQIAKPDDKSLSMKEDLIALEQELSEVCEDKNETTWIAFKMN